MVGAKNEAVSKNDMIHGGAAGDGEGGGSCRSGGCRRCRPRPKNFSKAFVNTTISFFFVVFFRFILYFHRCYF